MRILNHITLQRSWECEWAAGRVVLQYSMSLVHFRVWPLALWTQTPWGGGRHSGIDPNNQAHVTGI